MPVMKSFYDRAQKAVQKIKPYVQGKPVEEVRKKLGLRTVIKLASNESPFAPSAAVRRAVMKEMGNVHRYPCSGCPVLAGELSKKLKVRPGQIVFGNGSDELITLTLKGFIAEPREEVIVAHPTFLIYALQSTLSGARVVTVPMKRFTYDLEGMLRRITGRTKIIFVANPDNPTGTYVSDSALKSFLARVPSRVIVFVDEAYYEFARAQKKDYPFTLALLPRYKNLIVTRTFSKAYGLAGLRIGYAVTSSEIAEILNKVREPFNINRIAEVAARAALRETARVRCVVESIVEEKKRVVAALDGLGVGSVESATNFILVLLPAAENFVAYALTRGVIVRSMRGWGIPGAFRVTVGTKRENAQFLSVITRFIGAPRRNA